MTFTCISILSQYKITEAEVNLAYACFLGLSHIGF